MSPDLKAQKLSLRQLSDRTRGILSNSRMSNYEQGLRRPGIEEARILATALATVSATYLLCLEDAASLTEEEQQLLNQFRRADARGKEIISAIAAVEGERSR